MNNEKIDLKKVDKELYKGNVGEFKKVFCDKAYYLAIDGGGNPNDNPDYINKIASLYKVIYGIKMSLKKEGKDFVVMPLNGLWWSEDYDNFINDVREQWKWTMMIRVPDFVTEKELIERKEILKDGELYSYIEEIRYIEYTEGDAYQTLYVGPYSEEGDTVAKLHKTILENGFKLNGKHNEIYLSDPRKTEPSKLKTIIRQGYV